MTTDLIRKASIQELVAHRDRAMEAFQQALDLLASANAAAKRAAPGIHYIGGAYVAMTENRNRSAEFEAWRKSIDRDCWRHLLEATGLGALMGAKQRQAFEKGLQDNPPEFTVETAMATFRDKAENAEAIFHESIVHAFQSAPRGFVSNDRFHVGARMILDYAVTHYATYPMWYSSSYGAQARDIVRDLDRIMHRLDGKPCETDATDIVAQAMREGASECETAYFRFRWFKKTTMHVWFKREDLVRDMNRIIAKHFGAALGNAA